MLDSMSGPIWVAQGIGFACVKLAISIDEAAKLPIKNGLATFDLGDAGDKTEFVLTYEYEPGGGPFKFLMGPMLDWQLKKGFGGFIDDLDKAAQAQPAT